MCECLGGCGYELLSERVNTLERELEHAVRERDGKRIAKLQERIAELRCGCRRLREAAA